MLENSQNYGNLSIDFRTGLPTAITGRETGESQRAACAALNRKRARGIRKAAQDDAPGESVSAHVWQSSFERKVRDWEVPPIFARRLLLSGARMSHGSLVIFIVEISCEIQPLGLV